MADTRIRYGAGYQGGVPSAAVGQAVGARGAPPAEDTPARDILGPDTEAGQALLVLLLSFGFLFVAVGPEGGLLQRGSRMLGVIAGTGAAMVAVNFTARTYVARHPDGPLAAGLFHDL